MLAIVNTTLDPGEQPFATRNRGVLRVNANELVRFWQAFHAVWQGRDQLQQTEKAELERWSDVGLEVISCRCSRAASGWDSAF